MVQVDLNEIIDYIYRNAMNDGFILTHKEIFEVLMLNQEFLTKKFTQTIAEAEADED